MRVAVAQVPEPDLVAARLHELGIVEHVDLGVALRGLGRRGRAGEVVPAHEYGHVARILGEKDALLGRGEAAAHHEDPLSREELAIAGGAVGHAAPAELLLAGKPQAARARPGGEKDREAGELPARGAHALDVARQVEPRHLGEQELRAERLGLPSHGLGELGAARGEDAGVVHHLARDGDLPAERLALDHEHAVARPREVEGRREAGRSAADDDGVVEALGVGPVGRVLLAQVLLAHSLLPMYEGRGRMPGRGPVRVFAHSAPTAGPPGRGWASASRRPAATWQGRPGRRARPRTWRPEPGAAAPWRCGQCRRP